MLHIGESKLDKNWRRKRLRSIGKMTRIYYHFCDLDIAMPMIFKENWRKCTEFLSFKMVPLQTMKRKLLHKSLVRLSENDARPDWEIDWNQRIRSYYLYYKVLNRQEDLLNILLLFCIFYSIDNFCTSLI